MKLNYIAFAIPLFAGLILLEYLVSKKKKLPVYQFEETIANLNIGIAERLADMLTTGAFFFVFSWIHRHFAIFTIHSTWLTWVLLFIATDFIWYWYHRLGHEVNLFWSVHVVHHQSNDFNFSVSARITVLQAFARGIFWSVLPLIGFPPTMISIFLLIHGTYPFFTHTQLIGKLGWLEYLFVTPSHHRVHHSSNPEYLDKNYGDILIIWDKIFATFAEESTKPKYGLTKPLNSYSFLWQHFHFHLEMLQALRFARTWQEKWKVVFGKPGHINPNIKPYLESKLLRRDRKHKSIVNLHRVIFIQTLFILIILFSTILYVHYLSSFQVFIISSFVLFSVINNGAMLEQKRWIFYLDVARITIIELYLYTIAPLPIMNFISIGLLLIIIIFFKTIEDRYRSYLYQFT